MKHKEFDIVTLGDLEIHPKADLMPRMTDEEFEDLKRDIGTFGVKVPLLVLEGTNQIIDGRHRYWAALEKSVIDVPVRYISNDRESLEMLIISVEEKRKHRSKSIYAGIVAGLFSAAKSVGKKKRATVGTENLRKAKEIQRKGHVTLSEEKLNEAEKGKKKKKEKKKSRHD